MSCQSSNSDQLPLNVLAKGNNQTVVLICNVGSSSPHQGNANTNKINLESLVPLAATTTTTTLPPSVKETKNNVHYKTKKQEKELEKQKKLLAKAEAKQKKEAEKAAKELLKKQKKEERCKIREKEEQEKREKREKREAERKRKQEELAEKIETKRKKEEEKEEMERSEQEKKNRLSQKFRGFFVDKQVKESKKPDLMPPSLPTLPWPTLTTERSDQFDQYLRTQSYTSDYLSTCKQNTITSCHSNAISKQPRFKLYQFSENHRPPYWGSYRKRSKVINGRRPFIKDEGLLDYSIDSDEEWEEEEPGESLSDSETESTGGGQQCEEDDEEDDGFFVPHGYLSEDEGNDSEGEISGDYRQQKQLAKAKAWEAEFNKKCNRLLPVYFTSSQLLTDTQRELMDRYSPAIVVLNHSSGPVCTGCSIAGCSVCNNITSGRQDLVSNTPSNNCHPVPELAMPDLIRLVHKSSIGLKRLVDTFLEYWKHRDSPDASVLNSSTSTTGRKQLQDGTVKTPCESPTQPSCGISKRQLEMKITAIASKESGFNKVWMVHDKVLEQYGLTDHITPLLPTPGPSPKPTASANVGMKSIKHFFNSPSDSNNRGVVKRSLLLETPPQKKRRVSLEPVIAIDDKENAIPTKEPFIDNKENSMPSLEPIAKVNATLPLDPVEDATPPTQVAPLPSTEEQSENMAITQTQGIDWKKQLQEMNKITVPVDIHM